MGEFYKEYDIETSHLSSVEQEALVVFKKIAKIAGEIFSKQKQLDAPGASLYPEDATKEELTKSAAKNPLILDQYSVVKRDPDGLLYAVDYYTEYKDEIDEIIRLLNSAADIYQEGEYAEYLRQLARDHKSNDYAESEKMWLAIEGNDLDIKVGPAEKYIDRLMGLKRGFNANIRIKERSGKYDDLVVYNSVLSKIYPESPFGGDKPELDLKIRFDNIVAVGGWHAYMTPPANNYPKFDVLHGEIWSHAKDLVYINNLIGSDKFKIQNSIDQIYSNSAKELLDLDNAGYYSVMYGSVHDIAVSIVRYKDYGSRNTNLGHRRDTIMNIVTEVMAIKAVAHQVSLGLESTKNYQNLLAMFPLRKLHIKNWGQTKGTDYKRTFTDGGSVVVGYFIKHKGITFDDQNKMILDLKKMSDLSDQLYSVLMNMLQSGTEDEAKKFFSEYSSES